MTCVDIVNIVQMHDTAPNSVNQWYLTDENTKWEDFIISWPF